MSPDDLALKVAHNDAPLVIDALAALGYTFEVPGTPGRYHELDEGQHSMRLYLVGKTGLQMQIVREIMAAIHSTGLRVREPDAHPSGLRTTEPAFANVLQSGARRAAAQKPIDQRMPGMGKNYV